MSAENTIPEDAPPAPADPLCGHVIGSLHPPVRPRPFEEEGLVALPPDWKLESIQHRLARPIRGRGQYVVTSLEGVVMLLRRFADQRKDAIGMLELSSPENPLRLGGRLIVYFEAFEGSTPGHMDWSALMPFEQTAAYKRLVEFQASGGDHKALVAFLDPMLPYLVRPDASTIMENLVKISLTQEVKFNRAEQSATGDTTFSIETVTGQASAAGRVKLPDRLEFALPVFRNHKAAWFVSFELRYRLREDNVRFSLYHPDLADSLTSDFLPGFVSEIRGALGPCEVVQGVFNPGT